MMGHGPDPGMELGDDADLSAQPPGIGGHGLQRLGCDLHQQCIGDRLVMKGDLGNA